IVTSNPVIGSLPFIWWRAQPIDQPPTDFPASPFHRSSFFLRRTICQPVTVPAAKVPFVERKVQLSHATIANGASSPPADTRETRASDRPHYGQSNRLRAERASVFDIQVQLAIRPRPQFVADRPSIPPVQPQVEFPAKLPVADDFVKRSS